jgi:hypothetical protein
MKLKRIRALDFLDDELLALLAGGSPLGSKPYPRDTESGCTVLRMPEFRSH